MSVDQRMASIPRSGPGLGDLPNELIVEIAEWLHAGEPRTPPLDCRKYLPLHVFALVNRHIRQVVLPLMRRDVVFSGRAEILEFLWILADDPRLRSIRSVRIEGPVHLMLSSTRGPRLPLHLKNLFGRLERFECISIFCNEKLLSWLDCYTHLRYLRMAWRCLDAFPRMEKLPSVDTLRLFTIMCDIEQLDDAVAMNYESCAPMLAKVDRTQIYASITSLDLSDCLVFSRAHRECLQNVYFPNLRTFRSTGCPNATFVFQFVHIHPTLMEVSACVTPFPPTATRQRIRFEALVELINGTGTWMQPTGRYASNHDDTVDILDDMTADPSEFNPPCIDGSHITFDQFAFTRVPCSPDATTWDLPMGSPHQRYECTALAFVILDQEYWSYKTCRWSTPRDAVDLVGGLFPKINELRVTSSYADTNETNFSRWMSALGDHLRQCSHLRKLAMHWPLPAQDHKWVWGLPEHTEILADAVGDTVLSEEELAYPGSDSDENRWNEERRLGPWVMHNREYVRPRVLYLNSVEPPIARWTVNRRRPRSERNVPTFSLNELRSARVYHDYAVDDLEAAVREALYIDEAEPLDKDDRNLIMRAWQAHNEHTVARLVRYMAEQCPTLEEFEWYPKDALTDSPCSVRWLWKIKRARTSGALTGTADAGSKAKRSVESVTGTLTWPGCVQGHPPHMYILVGEGLQNVYNETTGLFRG